MPNRLVALDVPASHVCDAGFRPLTLHSLSLRDSRWPVLRQGTIHQDYNFREYGTPNVAAGYLVLAIEPSGASDRVTCRLVANHDEQLFNRTVYASIENFCFP